MNNLKNKTLRKVIAVSLALLLMIPLLTACLGGNNSEVETQQVLRLANDNGWVGEYGEAFREFTELYEFSHPNITMEYMELVEENRYYYGENQNQEERPDPYKKLKEAMTGPNPPDVVFLNYNNLGDLVDENLLMPLDAYITKDEMDLTKFVPAVIEGIKRYGDGQMYALAPYFSSSAIIYNQGIFDNAGVPYPTDEMTWSETFDLARRVSGGEGEDRNFGFAFTTYQGSDPFWDLQQYTAPLQLKTFDDNGDKMTVDSAQWADAWEMMVSLRQEKITPEPPNYEEMDHSEPRSYNPFEHDVFMSGKVAMAIADSHYLNQIIDANKNADRIEGYDPIRWDIVSLPTHPEAPGIGGNVWMNGIMAINAKAQNPDAAWDFVKFVNGEDFARIKSKSSYQLMSYQEYNKPRGGESYNMEAFYKLSPAPAQDQSELYRKYPNLWEVQNIGQMKFQEVLKGDKTVEEALAEWQTEGDARLKEMRENPTEQGGEIGIPRPIETFEESSTEVIIEDDLTEEELKMLEEEKQKLMEAAGEVETSVEAEASAEIAE
jgi:multiple sugar transport system substrate-binding protein